MLVSLLSHRSNDPVSREEEGRRYFSKIVGNSGESQCVTLLGRGTVWGVSNFDQDFLLSMTPSDQCRHCDNRVIVGRNKLLQHMPH